MIIYPPANPTWNLVESIEISSGGNYVFSGLDGDSVSAFKIEFNGIVDSVGGNTRIVVRPNSAATGFNFFTHHTLNGGTAKITETAADGMYMFRNDLVKQAIVTSELTFTSKSNAFFRSAIGSSSVVHVDTRILTFDCRGMWVNNDNITSIEIKALDNNGFMVGTATLSVLK